MSIGQGAVTVTPIQVARMLGGIATGGPLLQPRVVLMTYDRTRSAHPSEPYVQRSVPYQDSTLALLREGMRAVVERGSGYGARVERSEERRVGKECIEPCRSRWSPY